MTDATAEILTAADFAPGESSLLDPIETKIHRAPCPQFDGTAVEDDWDYRHVARKGLEREWLATYHALERSCGVMHQRPLQNFRDCGRYAYFAWVEETRRVILVRNACRSRWCPICARSKASFITEQATAWLKKITEPKFLTLTLRSTDAPLSEQVDRLYDGLRLLRRRKFFKDAARGGVWFFQLTYNRDRKQWHPHLHILMDSNYLQKSALIAAWQEITGDSYIIDIKAVWNPESAAAYVARYVSRPAELSSVAEQLQDELLTTCKGRRLAGSWGTGKAIDLGNPKPGERTLVQLPSYRCVTAMMQFTPELKEIFTAWATSSEIEQPQNCRIWNEAFYDWTAAGGEWEPVPWP